MLHLCGVRPRLLGHGISIRDGQHDTQGEARDWVPPTTARIRARIIRMGDMPAQWMCAETRRGARRQEQSMKSNERDMAIRPAQPATSLAALAGPRGVGTAVAFDWALAAEMIFLAARFALGIGSASMPMMLSSSQRTGATAAVLLAAVPCGLVKGC